VSAASADANRPFVAKNGDRLDEMSSWDADQQVFILDRSRRALSQRPDGAAPKRPVDLAPRPTRRRK
jgi:hypothetical protein